MTDPISAARLTINGIVQGVGFRPFIYQLARQHGLAGEVANTATGVSLVLEGPTERIDRFIDDLPHKTPPLAHVVEVTRDPATVQGFAGFSIVKSQAGTTRATLISPDVMVCEECLAEMRDPANRRYRYPFINCTNCGPRYTIIDDIPYDRPKTSMRHFSMCAPCQAEYDDPDNRRFHAQPNACPVCGPQVRLCDARGMAIPSDDPINEAARRIQAGRIVAVKGLGGFHLAVDATNAVAVARLRRRKHREEKPFALMCADMERIRTIAHVNDAEAELLQSIQRPIVLLEKRKNTTIAASVAPGNRCFGIMLPYAPLHHLLLDADFTALVMTSANLSEEPIAIDNAEAFTRLAGIADDFLIHNRDIYLRSDDSIVRHSAGHRRPLRRSRGYVPVPVFLKDEVPAVLACGAELKNTVCLTRGRQAFVSQHIGDLENRATDDFFRLTIRHLKRILDIDPTVVACDLHPDYLSTRYAREQTDRPVVAVQHHHAHIAACMAENRADGPVIGLSLDGTGLGSDGTIWGGEVLVAEYHRFRRAAHLAAVPMPGSAAAIREPWRMALAHLHAAFGAMPDLTGLPLAGAVDDRALQVVAQMIEKGVNSPLTSSLGRLFDAVAAIVGLRHRVAFEGQAAMELEAIADDTEPGTYAFGWRDAAGDDPLVIPCAPIIDAVLADLRHGHSPAVISARFHNTLVALFTALCRDLRHRTGIHTVALSGGVFQNDRLLTGLIAGLEGQRFEVLSHRQVPTNDGGLALGQAVVAAARMQGKD
jgi:hydrogenase maturation protein HypF